MHIARFIRAPAKLKKSMRGTNLLCSHQKKRTQIVVSCIVKHMPNELNEQSSAIRSFSFLIKC